MPRLGVQHACRPGTVSIVAAASSSVCRSRHITLPSHTHTTPPPPTRSLPDTRRTPVAASSSRRSSSRSQGGAVSAGSTRMQARYSEHCSCSKQQSMQAPPPHAAHSHPRHRSHPRSRPAATGATGTSPGWPHRGRDRGGASAVAAETADVAGVVTRGRSPRRDTTSNTNTKTQDQSSVPQLGAHAYATRLHQGQAPCHF